MQKRLGTGRQVQGLGKFGVMLGKALIPLHYFSDVTKRCSGCCGQSITHQNDLPNIAFGSKISRKRMADVLVVMIPGIMNNYPRMLLHRHSWSTMIVYARHNTRCTNHDSVPVF